MTNEEKELLLKDLCARLPHGVRVCYKIRLKDKPIDVTLSGLLLDYFNNKTVVEIKPFLRPMSSMNIEEGERLEQIAKETLGDFMFEAEEDGGAIYHMTKWKTLSPAMFDYLNSIHIDYRGLIGKGLALEAPERMYNN